MKNIPFQILYLIIASSFNISFSQLESFICVYFDQYFTLNIAVTI